ncbi:antibiotic biosynthesis monooxygenase [Aeromicrobium wangtongii]|uniref:antibiotic biosynthesis monooxygenase n=1 Tax=Aeromicrobium wangtongii TaxID=2969247 RepID=UPI002017D099|nr:antibiotic biosynthesis monooxygenase [Aeromicrobium wangtongii]MCL3819413.1 antibiotic biosynthesis monooxygenase [Aeromicrobium wangtongii]
MHELRAEPAQDTQLAEHARTLREEPGCLEAEWYRSLAGGGRVALVALWDDEVAYGRHWARVLSASDSGDPVLRGASARGQGETGGEFYRHQPYRLDTTWIPADHREDVAKIHWPAGGAVRIICQNSQSNVDEITPALLDNARETGREPGCVQFEWFTSVELAGHMLLLELWQDQVVYDAHWAFRLKTGSGALPARQSTERAQGTNGLEFYQHQPFTHLYDRWLPVDLGRWSETVIWAG